VNGHTNLRLTLNMLSPIPPDPWVSSQAMPHINYSLRQAGHSDTVADELTRALGLLAAHGVLQLTQSAAKTEASQGWAGESAGFAGSYGAPAAQPPTPGMAAMAKYVPATIDKYAHLSPATLSPVHPVACRIAIFKVSISISIKGLAF